MNMSNRGGFYFTQHNWHGRQTGQWDIPRDYMDQVKFRAEGF
jgi:hypothetical protein